MTQQVKSLAGKPGDLSLFPQILKDNYTANKFIIHKPINC